MMKEDVINNSGNNAKTFEKSHQLAIDSLLFGRNHYVIRDYRKFSAHDDGSYMTFERWKHNKLELDDLPDFLSRDDFFELTDSLLYEEYKKDKEQVVQEWKEEHQEKGEIADED